MKNFAIVSHLDVGLSDKVRELQKEISALTGSKASLEKNEPHVTIGDEILLEESGLESLYSNLQSIAEDFAPPTIKVECFGFMDSWVGGSSSSTPYVVYLVVKEFNELEKLVSKIKEDVTNHYKNNYRQPHPYTPHITLAYKDLMREGYDKAKEYLEDKTFSTSATINEFSLMTKDKNGRWVEHKKFLLKY